MVSGVMSLNWDLTIKCGNREVQKKKKKKEHACVLFCDGGFFGIPNTKVLASGSPAILGAGTGLIELSEWRPHPDSNSTIGRID